MKGLSGRIKIYVLPEIAWHGLDVPSRAFIKPRPISGFGRAFSEMVCGYGNPSIHPWVFWDSIPGGNPKLRHPMLQEVIIKLDEAPSLVSRIDISSFYPSSGVWPSSLQPDKLTAEHSRWAIETESGRTEEFDLSGTLIISRDPSSTFWTIFPSSNTPLTLTHFLEGKPN
jgi:hypothetical protein